MWSLFWFTKVSSVVPYEAHFCQLSSESWVIWRKGILLKQWRIQDFPDGGRQPIRGANLLLPQFFPKTAWKWRNVGSGPSPLDPPMLELTIKLLKQTSKYVQTCIGTRIHDLTVLLSSVSSCISMLSHCCEIKCKGNECCIFQGNCRNFFRKLTAYNVHKECATLSILVSGEFLI